MTVEHKNITDPNIHEPKGVASASSGQVYVGDGSGSGNWSSYDWTNLTGRKIALTTHIADISTASEVYLVVPFAGEITKIYSVIRNAITAADAVITTSIAGVNITGGSLTIAQSGSAAGDVDSATPTGNNGISEGQALKIESDGGSTTTCRAEFTIIIELS